jgi:hypothetical protein
VSNAPSVRRNLIGWAMFATMACAWTYGAWWISYSPDASTAEKVVIGILLALFIPGGAFMSYRVKSKESESERHGLSKKVQGPNV